MGDATESSPTISVGCCVDAGTVRTHNEDAAAAVTLPSGEHLLVVCDGMGGHANGDIASQIAVSTIQDVLTRQSAAQVNDRMVTALVEANNAIVARGREAGTALMGSTAAIALVDPEAQRCWAAWVGDSRVTVYRDGEEWLRTRDHSQVAMMVERGIISDEQARTHSEAGVLLQALGGGPQIQQNFAPEVWSQDCMLRDGDAVLVSSDGLHGAVRSVDVAHTLGGRVGIAAANALVELANLRSGEDNVAVAILNVGGAPVSIPEPAPPPPPEDPILVSTAPTAAGAETLIHREPRTRKSRPPTLLPIAVAVLASAVALVGAGWWLLRPSPPTPEIATVGPPLDPSDVVGIPGTPKAEEPTPAKTRRRRLAPQRPAAPPPEPDEDAEADTPDPPVGLDELLPLEVPHDGQATDARETTTDANHAGPEAPDEQQDEDDVVERPPGELL